MIKNNANKCAKQIETVKAAIVSPNTVHQTANEVDNNRSIATSQRVTYEPTDNQNEESDSVKPLSKIDIIKKFDSKYKSNTDAVDNKQTQYEESPKYFQNTDEVENDENIQNSNNFNAENKTRSNELDLAANNNYKNGNSYGNGNTEVVPPKPLPRTSRNNSISSLSSEQGVNAANEESIRPVAKPRTTTTATTTSYKVQLNTKFLFSHRFRSIFHYFVYFLPFLVFLKKSLQSLVVFDWIPFGLGLISSCLSFRFVFISFCGTIIK